MAGAIQKTAKARPKARSYTERGDCKVTLNALQPRGTAWHKTSSLMGLVPELERLSGCGGKLAKVGTRRYREVARGCVVGGADPI